MKGRLRRPLERNFAAALCALTALLAPLLLGLGGCSRLLSIVDPSAF